MARCAQILNGLVVNVIEADPETFSPDDASLVVASDAAQVGWTYADGAFTPVVPPVVYQTSELSFLQFLALFSPAEQAAIVASSDTQVRLFVLMASGAGSLDLANARVVAAVNYLAAIKLIAQSRVATVLSGAPPT